MFRRLAALAVLSLAGCGGAPVSAGDPPRYENSQFHIPEGDREAFSISERSATSLHMKFDAAVIYPSVQRNPKMNGSDLPRSAFIMLGVPDVGEVVPLSRGGERCAGALKSVQLTPKYEYTGDTQSKFDGVAARPSPETADVVAKFANAERTWFASCLLGMTCRVYVIHQNWSSMMTVREEDLCAVPSMNEKLSAIVRPWM